MSDFPTKRDKSKNVIQLKELIDELQKNFLKAEKHEQDYLLKVVKGWTQLGARKHARKLCSIPVVFTAEDRNITSMIKNISARGVFIDSTEGIEKGQKTSLTFWFPVLKKPSKLHAEAVWKTTEGYGAKFVTNNPKVGQALEKVVERL